MLTLNPLPLLPLRRFREQNPSIAAFDKASATPSGFTRTIASQFIDQQLARMRGGSDEAAAYKGARKWMMSEGPRLFGQLDLPGDVRAAALATPADVAATRTAGDNALAVQLAEIREALYVESRAAASPRQEEEETLMRAQTKAASAWKVFGGVGAESRAAALVSVTSRSASREPVFPRRPLEPAGESPSAVQSPTAPKVPFAPAARSSKARGARA